ncbi:MAG: potassium transporter TrkA [Clostridiales bacterium 43-6]|nr:MAG: potassium transporter TrkA [Clostridiales bacterium 43-6]
MAFHKQSFTYGIIGLGRFGLALAEALADSGLELMVLDNSEIKIKQIQDKVQQAYLVKQLDKATLSEAGIQNCETVIVCIGEHMEGSILTTLNVIELGVPRVIAKAISAEHGKVLSKIGAEVVFPEIDQAVHLANNLTSPRALDFIELSTEFAITEIRLSEKFNGKAVSEIDFRRRFGLNIIAVVREDKTIIEITPDFMFKTNDMIAVIGEKNNMKRFEKYNS